LGLKSAREIIFVNGRERENVFGIGSNLAAVKLKLFKPPCL
jgi:hypothetical protein